jgi:hypothetical protein
MVLTGRKLLDEGGNAWLVFRAGSFFTVDPAPPPGRTLHQVACSCAKVLGLTRTPDGTPVEHVNEHIHIWNAIWKQGKEVKVALAEHGRTSEEQS